MGRVRSAGFYRERICVGSLICRLEDGTEFYRGLVGERGRFFSGNFFELLRTAQERGYNLPTLKQARDFSETTQGKVFLSHFWIKLLGFLEFSDAGVSYHTGFEAHPTEDIFLKHLIIELPESQINNLKRQGRIIKYDEIGFPEQIDYGNAKDPPQYRCIPHGIRILRMGGKIDDIVIDLCARDSPYIKDQKFPLVVKSIRKY